MIKHYMQKYNEIPNANFKEVIRINIFLKNVLNAYFLTLFRLALAAASLATGTLKGEQLTYSSPS